MMDYICGKRLAPILGEMVERLLWPNEVRCDALPPSSPGTSTPSPTPTPTPASTPTPIVITSHSNSNFNVGLPLGTDFGISPFQAHNLLAGTGVKDDLLPVIRHEDWYPVAERVAVGEVSVRRVVEVAQPAIFMRA